MRDATRLNKAGGGTWAEGSAELVSPGVYRVPLPLPMDGLRAVNVYILENDRGLTCIDGGWAIVASREKLERSLRELGHHPRDITSFLVTHAHRDHYSQAAAIRAEFGRAAVWLGAADRPTLQAVRQGTGPRAFDTRLARAGAHHLAEEWAEALRDDDEFNAHHWSDPDAWLDSDATIEVGDRVLSAVHTPGHTAGHFVFAEIDAGVLFAGDHVLPTITPSVGFEVGLVGLGAADGRLPLADYLASLAKVRALPDLQLLPAHGGADRRSHERVDELLTHHAVRLQQCLDAVERGDTNAWEVAHRLPWTRAGRALAELDTFNSGLAVLETLLHLELLVSQGRLIHKAVDGVDEFTAVTRPATS